MIRRLSLSRFPIWVKILVFLSLMLLVLIIPSTLVLGSAIEGVARQQGTSYVAQVGLEQSSVIANNIAQAGQALTDFVTQPENERALSSLLVGGIRTEAQINLPDVRPREIESLIDDTILNPAATLYESVRVIDRDGQVVASSQLSTAIGRAQEDESQSVAFLAAEAAALAGQISTLVADEVYGIGQLEYTQAVQWYDGRILGYVIGTISNSRAIFPYLDYPPDGYPGFSYLENATGIVISPTDRLFELAPGSASALVSQALSGAQGTQAFSANDTQFLGYFTPVRGTPMALIAQIPLSAPLATASQTFAARNIVMFVAAVLVVTVMAGLMHSLIAVPLGRLRRSADTMTAGDLMTPVPDTGRGDEVGRLADAMDGLRSTLSARVSDLETRVASRTRDIQATQDIARYAATERSVQALMDRVVDLIIERFPDIYHAQIFLVDGAGQQAVVRASTGTVGLELLRRGHRLPVGSISVIGQVTEQGRPVLARDTSTSPVHKRNEFLPDTRAELAIPLALGRDVIGALDVQSKSEDAFDDELITVLQTMAGQLAVAIQNARLYEENSQRAAELQAANLRTTRESWVDFMRGQRRGMLESEVGFIGDGPTSPLRERAMREGQPVTGTRTPHNTIPIAVPIRLRGQTLGAVEWELPAATFSHEQVELARELSDRLAVSLENARLFAESRRAAERERQVNQIAAQLTTRANLDDILRTAVREIGRALGAPQVTIRMDSGDSIAEPGN